MGLAAYVDLMSALLLVLVTAWIVIVGMCCRELLEWRGWAQRGHGLLDFPTGSLIVLWILGGVWLGAIATGWLALEGLLFHSDRERLEAQWAAGGHRPTLAPCYPESAPQPLGKALLALGIGILVALAFCVLVAALRGSVG